jgi:hypothetical protein
MHEIRAVRCGSKREHAHFDAAHRHVISTRDVSRTQQQFDRLRSTRRVRQERRRAVRQHHVPRRSDLL